MPANSPKPPPRASLMARLGLGRPELRAWALYDWANSVFMTIILLVYPIYFTRVAGADLAPVVATARIAFATAISMTLIAVLSPILGAMADHAGIKKKMLAVFLGFGAAATAALYFVGRGQWLLGAVLFVIGNIGVTGTIVFYESLLPHIAAHDEVDRVSMAGYALGYLGGGLLLIVALVAIQKPALFGIPDAREAMRISFVATAVWWVVFSIPLFFGKRLQDRRQIILELLAQPLDRAAAVLDHLGRLLVRQQRQQQVLEGREFMPARGRVVRR